MSETIEDAWNTYQREEIPRTAPVVQQDACRRAFYAGAYALWRCALEGSMSERVENTILDDWLRARMIIVAWLRELIPHVAPGAAEKAAEALIARFAAHEPPLLLMTPPAVGEDDA